MIGKEGPLFFIRDCPICTSNQFSLISEYSRFQFYTQDSEDSKQEVSISTVKCNECSAIYMNPAYSEFGMTALFGQAGQSYGASEGRESEQVEWLESLNLLSGITSVLDIGCYDGRFLRTFPNGIKRIGIDFDQVAIDSAAAHDPEGEYFCGLIENSDQSQFGEIDLISLIHSIEHTANPRSLLEALLAICHPKTIVYIETPIIELATLFDGDVNGFFSVQHMTHFSRNSLRKLVEDSGFSILNWYEHPEYNASRLIMSPKAEGVRALEFDAQENFEAVELHHYLESWHKSIKIVLNNLYEGLKSAENLVIWGAGTHTELLFQHAGTFWSPFKTKVVDKDPKKIGRYFRGLKVEPIETLLTMDFTTTMFLISSYSATEEIAHELATMGVPESRLIRLYDEIRAY
jgi:2-polyprenyl-3-methyl-5-hydroxy-6-metoxy-1,4-benzoquinol methylase